MVKSIKVSKAPSERRHKPPAKRQAGVRRRNSAPAGKSAAKSTEVVTSAEPLVNVVEEVEDVEQLSGDYSDSVTRCICNFTHDDGYMICCDQCQ